jgi:hypothetical protein
MTRKLQLDDQIRPVPGVLVQKVGDEAVILNLNSEQYLGFDAVGARMWEVLTTAPSLRGGLEMLLSEYEVDAGRLEADLLCFAGQLVDRGLAGVATAR